jgi:hypothetical protein
MISILQSAVVGVRQPNPPEGRKALPLNQQGGGGITFATGAEVFSFDTKSLGNAEVSGIYGAWVDASQLTLGTSPNINYLKIVVSSSSGISQTFLTPTGSQGYIVIIAQKHVSVLITTQNVGGVAGSCQVILYNYNPLFTGVDTTGASAAAGAGAAGAASQGTGSNPGEHIGQFRNIFVSPGG